MNKLQSAVTKLYIKDRKVKDIVRLCLLNGISIEVVVFINKKALYPAQTTIVNTIIAEESVFSDYSDTARDYVFTHEYAHTKQNCLNAMILLVLMLFIASLYIVRGEGLLFLTSLISTTIMILILSWLMEIGAEFYTLNNLGKNWVLEAKREIKSLNPAISVSKLVVYRLTHPKIELVIRIHDFLRRFKR